MNETTLAPPWLTRPRLFRIAWLLLLASLLFPIFATPDAGSFALSAVHVVHRALAWSDALPGDADRLGLLQESVLCLALFTNILFLYAAYLPAKHRVSVAWKAMSLGALLIGLAVGVSVPELLRLPAYGLWLAALVLTVVGFAWVGDDTEPSERASSSASVIDRGEMPPLVIMLLGFTLFWVVINWAERAFLSPTAISATHALKGYVNDSAQVLQHDEASRLDVALQGFEKSTTMQIAVAIYPRVPNGSIEEFTLRAAERLPLGRPDLDNGALLFVFVAERAARLEVGYGLEGTLTDVGAKRLLEANLAPALAHGDYYGGIDATLKAMFAQLGVHAPAPDALTRWSKHLRPGQPKFAERSLRAISRISFGHRILFTFLGTFALFMVWTPPSMRRTPSKKSRAQAAPDESNAFDAVRGLWALSTLIPTAIAMIVVGGGMFGGAGALIHW